MTQPDASQPAPTVPADRRNLARLLVEGDDHPGIVAAVSATLAGHHANIVSLNQYSTNPAGGHFFQRTVFDLPNLEAALPSLENDLNDEIGAGLGLRWSLHRVAETKRVAIFASKADHCLVELLWRQRRGELDMNVTMVISNHPDLADDVEQFGVPFFHVPVTSGKAEAEHLRLLRGKVDFIVLARYMRILSAEFIEAAAVPIINIHHSFLPAFIGAGPYKKAKERGVKLVGATAHYVTADLDAGPIIEQDVVRVSHAETTEELTLLGADVERLVLARAVKWHCKDRVIRYGNQTVVFSS